MPHTAAALGGNGYQVRALYSPEERKRRDETGWTTVQGILAPIQFIVFVVSLYLVYSFLRTGDGAWLAGSQ